MKTPFHLKLLAMVEQHRIDDRHWVLKGARTVRLPDGQVVTTKCALYAAFIGDIPPKHEVVSTCILGADCVRPEHQVTKERPASHARGLSLPEQIAALSKPGAFQPVVVPNLLPKGMTARQINMVKYLARQGNSIAQIRTATLLPMHEIMKIRNGIYDEALKNVSNSSVRGRAEKDIHRAKSPADLPDQSLPAPPQAVHKESSIDLDGLSEEDQAWLKSIENL